MKKISKSLVVVPILALSIAGVALAGSFSGAFPNNWQGGSFDSSTYTPTTDSVTVNYIQNTGVSTSTAAVDYSTYYSNWGSTQIELTPVKGNNTSIKSMKMGAMPNYSNFLKMANKNPSYITTGSYAVFW